MRSIYLFFLWTLLSVLCLEATAQVNLPILTWRSHLSYKNIVDVTASQDRIYAAAENALFFVDQQDQSINKITKNDGLSDVAIGVIHYDESLDVLVIGYVNGNIDFIFENQIINLSTIKDANLIGSKRFNDVEVNNGLVYMASDQGIFVINPDRQEIIESYRNLSSTGDPLAVSGISFTNDSIYVATPEGLLSASLSENVNRQDFNNWRRNITNRLFGSVLNSGNDLVAASLDQLYQFDGTNWTQSGYAFQGIIEDLSISNGRIFALTQPEVVNIENGMVQNFLNLDQTYFKTSLLHNGAGFWFGELNNGLVFRDLPGRQIFTPSGPSTDQIWRLTQSNGEVYNLAGGHTLRLDPLNRAFPVSKFSENVWTSLEVEHLNQPIPDIVDLAVLSNSLLGSSLFAASFQDGLVNLADPTILIDENRPGSTLQRDNGNINMTSIATEGSALWMSTYGFDNSIHRWDLETDSWQAFSFGFSQSRYPLDILVLPNGDKWVSLDPNRGGGILVFNEQTNAERHLNINGGQGGLPGREVTSMVLDQNFLLWVGTNAGIAFYPNPTNILNGNSVSASIPIFENSFLLRNEFITSVAIDPGNRKWIGTLSNGVWLFSETGEELVHHFTEDNSPLLSNHILDIEVEANSGEVFIGTNNGLVSFQSDAIIGQDQHSNVKAFPNPVTRDFTGVVTISGLVNAAQVKITDVSGKLVREIRANGSSATWDANDYNGRRVKTGVYLVFSSNADGTETFVSKIAVI